MSKFDKAVRRLDERIITLCIRYSEICGTDTSSFEKDEHLKWRIKGLKEAMKVIQGTSRKHL